MFGTRQVSASARARSTLALSVLALLAFASLPGLARADSGEIEYQDAPPTVTGKAPSDHEPSAGSSQAPGGGANSGSSGGGSSPGGSSSGSGGPAGKATDGGTGSQGSPGAQTDQGSVGSGKEIGNGSQAATTGQSDGGSSPLLPILIAIVVLAAISLGTVIYRRRRGSPASRSPVSPEAG